MSFTVVKTLSQLGSFTCIPQLLGAGAGLASHFLFTVSSLFMPETILPASNKKMAPILYTITTSFSFIATYIIYKLSKIYSPVYFPSYKSLSVAKSIDWDSRISSNVHAVLVSVFGLYALWFDLETAANPVWNDSCLIRMIVSITLGYGGADWRPEYGYPSYSYNPGILLCCVLGVLPYFAIFRMIAEFSTPFVNQRWFYDAVGKSRKSPEFLSIGIMLAITFFLARIMVMPVYYLRCWQVWFTPEREQLGIVICCIWILHVLFSIS